jgi:hypothetical protein
MATYKVLQDIEAEDKLVGPLTLRQFIYAAVTAICLYIGFLLITKGAPLIAFIFLPPAMVTGFFAFPWGREQPTEIWALAKMRFMIKPRKRIWDQSGVKELVTVTAPKRVEPFYTSNLSQNEVSSRLHALADTIDSRGWAIKNVQTGMSTMPTVTGVNPADSDRLVGVNILPEVQPLAGTPADDMMDEQTSPIAKQFDQMIKQSNAQHHERILQEISQAQAAPPPPPPVPAPTTTPPNDYWFLNQSPVSGPVQTVHPTTAVASSEPTPEEQLLAHQLKEQNRDGISIAYGHLRTIQPLSKQAKAAATQPQTDASTPVTHAAVPAPAPVAPKTTTPPVTHQPNPATLKYVNNDDLRWPRSLGRLMKIRPTKSSYRYTNEQV